VRPRRRGKGHTNLKIVSRGRSVLTRETAGHTRTTEGSLGFSLWLGIDVDLVFVFIFSLYFLVLALSITGTVVVLFVPPLALVKACADHGRRGGWWVKVHYLAHHFHHRRLLRLQHL
jgi:hypothetical protein